MNLDALNVGDEAVMPLNKLPEARIAVQDMMISTPSKLFTVLELDQAVFKIRRLR